MSKRRTFFALGAAILAITLAGCATGAGGNGAPTPTEGGVSGDVDASSPIDPRPVVAWFAQGAAIGIVTYGSSSCVPVADVVTADGQDVTITLTVPETRACTADLAPRGTVAVTPDGVDVTQPVTVHVTGSEGDATLELPATTGGGGIDQEMRASWLSPNAIGLLTWGSSSCRPIIQDVTAASENTATVQFAPLPDGAACTRDLVPRLVIVSVDQLTTGATLIVQGDGAAIADGTVTVDGEQPK